MTVMGTGSTGREGVSQAGAARIEEGVVSIEKVVTEEIVVIKDIIQL